MNTERLKKRIDKIENTHGKANISPNPKYPYPDSSRGLFWTSREAYKKAGILLSDAVKTDVSINDIDAKMKEWGAYRRKHSISSLERPSELPEVLLDMVKFGLTL